MRGWRVWAARRGLVRAGRGADPGDRGVLRARNRLAVARYRAGQLEPADTEMSATVAACRAWLGPDDRDTLIAEGNLAAIRLACGHPHPHHAGLAENNPGGRAAADGPGTRTDHPVAAHQAAAGTSAPQGALELLAAAVTARTRVFGPGHPLTLDAGHGLGVAHRLADQPEPGHRVLIECWRARRRVLGPGHRDTRRTGAEIAALQRETRPLEITGPRPSEPPPPAQSPSNTPAAVPERGAGLFTPGGSDTN